MEEQNNFKFTFFVSDENARIYHKNKANEMGLMLDEYFETNNLNDEVSVFKSLYTKSFSADDYNQITRYSVNIKNIAKEIISDLRGILSLKTEELNFDIHGYDLRDLTHSDDVKLERFYYNHRDVKLITRNRKNRLFKFVFYINDSIIIERVFNAYGFNRDSLNSTNLFDLLDYWVSQIQEKIKEKDKEQMWDEYQINGKFNIPILTIRNMVDEEKQKLLNEIFCN